jgi:predicted nucleotidyltransferase
MTNPDLFSRNFITMCKTHKVKELYVFGAVLNGNFTDESDLEMLVDIDEADPLIRGELLRSLLEGLEAYCERKVDLLTPSSLRNHYLLETINNTKRLIYDGSKGDIVR